MMKLRSLAPLGSVARDLLLQAVEGEPFVVGALRVLQHPLSERVRTQVVAQFHARRARRVQSERRQR
jgi:hypothetical protein